MEYRIENDDSILVKLSSGDDVIESLKLLAEKLHIDGAFFVGIGTFSHAELGFFYPDKKEYARKKFDGDFELLSMTGNIGIGPDNEKVVHAHVVLSDDDFKCFGGHLFKGIVSVVAEIQIYRCSRINRTPHPVGLNLWKLY